MPSLAINIPAAQLDRIVNALCAAAGVAPSPAAAKQALISMITATVANVETVQPPPTPPDVSNLGLT